MVLGTGVLVGLVGTSSAQFISLDGTTEPILVHAKSNDVLLTAELTDASLKDVTDWLTRSRLNFVIDRTGVDPEKRVDLHFKEIPGRQVLKTVAEAFGLQLTEVEGVVVLRGQQASLPVITPVAGSPLPPLTQPDKSQKLTVQEMDGKLIIKQTNPPLLRVITPPPFSGFSGAGPQSAELEKAVKEAEDAAREAERATDLSTARAAARRAADAARRAANLARKPLPFSFSRTMDPMSKEEFDKVMKALPPFAFDEKARADMEKAMKDFKFDEKTRAEMEKAMKEMPTIPFRKIKPREFMDSLTESQKALMKKQGYLNLKDLTDKQREMLGNPNGQMKMLFDLAGNKIEIRGDATSEDGRV